MAHLMIEWALMKQKDLDQPKYLNRRINVQFHKRTTPDYGHLRINRDYSHSFPIVHSLYSPENNELPYYTLCTLVHVLSSEIPMFLVS